MSNKKILFDGTFLDQKNGIGRDSRYILDCLEGDIEVLIYKDQRNIEFQWNYPLSISPLKRRQSQLFSFLTKRSFSTDSDVDLFFLPQITSELVYQKEKKRLIRCHDLFPVTNPEWFTLKSRVRFKESLKHIKKSDVFVCNSKFTANQLYNIFDSDEISCVVFYPQKRSLDSTSCGNCDACQSGVSIDSYILMVGTIEPRKNYKIAIKGFLESQTEMSLVIVGNRGWKESESNLQISDNKKILLMKNVCDGGLVNLYKNCSVFLSASINEGFNLPLWEAREYGARTIVSDIEVHRELHPDIVHFFDSRDPSSLSTLINDPKKWNTPRRSGPQIENSLMDLLESYL